MNTIWVIEKSTCSEQPITQALIGNFPVRVFSSLASFQKLTILSKSQKPSLLILDIDDEKTSIAALESLLAILLPGVLRIYVSNTRLTVPLEENAIHVLKPIDALNFSVFVEHLLTKPGSAKYAVSYKSLSLDLTKYVISCAVSGTSEPLPVKEARILKLLIDRRGQCISRDDIKNEIWTGVAVSPRTIDSHISRLRKKLEHAEIVIESVYGDGYSLK
jgi:hypothetical protein